jgi:hypothetical protein
MLSCMILQSSAAVWLDLLGYRGFVAKGLLCLERLIRCYLVVLRSNKPNHVLSGRRIRGVASDELRNMYRGTVCAEAVRNSLSPLFSSVHTFPSYSNIHGGVTIQLVP